jgi:CubicO group peptidase (beta-lactamase class C family)
LRASSRHSVAVLALIAVAACSHPRVAPAPLLPNNSIPLNTRLTDARRVLDSAIDAGAAPGAVLAVSVHGERDIYATGVIGVGETAKPTGQTLYDMASLTKVIALTTLSMMAVNDHRLDLDLPVVHYLPEFANGKGAKDKVTVRDLLLHDSGLPADRPLYLQTSDRESAIALTLRTDLDTLPGTRMLYSDLGAITLTAIIEKLYHTRIDKLFADRVAGPLGLKRMMYLPPKALLPEIAPTEDDPWRKRLIRGEVHDENASRMDGVSGHAGLFSDAEDLLRFGEWALAGARGEKVKGKLQPPEEFATWTIRQNHPVGSSRGIGWDTPSGPLSSAGTIMSAHSFGHTGFTGTSIWVDVDRDIVVVLLTNRVNPVRTTPAFGMIRSVVADAVLRGIARCNAIVGLAPVLGDAPGGCVRR